LRQRSPGAAGRPARHKAEVSSLPRIGSMDPIRPHTEPDPASAPREALLAELRLSEARLRLIFDNVPALIGYFDQNHVYQYANKGYTDWFGRGRDIAAGRPIIDVLPPKVYAVVIPHVVQALKGSRQRYEYEMARDDGSIVNLADMKPLVEDSHCSAKPVRYVLEMNQGWFARRGIKAGARLGGAPFLSK
jgi:PAS domain S-box-containing protein